MNHTTIKAVLTATTLMLLPFSAQAAGSVPSGKAVTVQFARGATFADYRGQIRGLSVDRYRFTARQGQVLNVLTDNSDNNIVATVNYLGNNGSGDELATVDQILPASGRYEVQVMQTRNGARQGNASRPYQLRIQITNNGQAASPAPKAETAAGNEIRFAPGTSSASINGKLRGLTVKTYRITARQGQVLNIDDYGSNPNIVTTLNYVGAGVDNDALTTTDQVLPRDGAYEIRVMQTRNGARQGAQWRDYRLNVSIR